MVFKPCSLETWNFTLTFIKNLKRFSVFVHITSTLWKQLLMWTCEFNRRTGKNHFTDWLKAQDHRCKLRLDLRLIPINKVTLLNLLDSDWSHRKAQESESSILLQVADVMPCYFMWNTSALAACLWKTRNCPGIFPQKLPFKGRFYSKVSSGSTYVAFLTVLPHYSFTRSRQTHLQWTFHETNSLLPQPHVIFYFLIQKKLAERPSEESKCQVTEKQRTPRSCWPMGLHDLRSMKGQRL